MFVILRVEVHSILFISERDNPSISLETINEKRTLAALGQFKVSMYIIVHKIKQYKNLFILKVLHFKQ